MRQDKIKVLFLSSAPIVAGAEINLISLLRTICKDKFECHLMYNSLSHMEQYLTCDQLKLVPFPLVSNTPNSVINKILTILATCAYIFKHKIQCVYSNTIHPFNWLITSIKLMGLSVLAHIHIDESDKDLRWIGINQVDRILFPSEYLRKVVLLHSPWLGGEKCFTVLNAVDSEVYFPRNVKYLRRVLALEEGIPVVGIVGQLKETKGQHLFLEMVKRLTDFGIQSYYLIVGDDNLQNGRYLAFLKTMAEQLGVADRVKFVGFRKDMPEIMSLLDLLICPSLLESFGRVVIEAMACGTPVLASAVGGISEIIIDSKGGLLFEPGNIDELTEKAISFYEKPEWWREQGVTAFEVARTRFCQEDHTRQVEYHVKSVIKSLFS